MAICGVKVRMDGAKTALNGAMFQCCKLPELPFNLPSSANTESSTVSEDFPIDSRIASSNTVYDFVFESNGM